jgi:hypothetical protein
MKAFLSHSKFMATTAPKGEFEQQFEKLGEGCLLISRKVTLNWYLGKNGLLH